MTKYLFLLFSFSSSAGLFSQGQADWWYFGSLAGIHFETGGPVAVNDGQLSTSEGCASISDQAGNLLFYTDGLTVYDKTHTVMPNGTGLLGSPSSSQSAVVVPKPQSSSEYYIFTVDDGAGVDGMQYSKVDLTLNGGLGDVVTSEKNIPLVAPTPEKISVLKKSNGYWVVTMKIPGDTLYAYSVTSSGVNLVPVTSNTGLSLTSSNFWGYLKPNVQSTKLGFISQGIQEVYVFDFDVASGTVTGLDTITQSIGGGTGYGIEFSPDGNLLYSMSYSTCDLKQYDLNAGNSAAISASEVLLGSASLSGGGALQTGPDGKMYICRASKPYLSVLEFPNIYGSGASFIDTAVVLSTGTNCILGLPTFIQSFFNASFEVENFCLGVETEFSMDTVGVDSVLWNFGEPSSGLNNTSGLFFPTHVYGDTGSYEIQLIAFADTLIDTVYRNIYIYPRQTIDLGDDLEFCRNEVTEFSAAQPFAQFLWHDSTTADTFLTTNDTIVWVTVFGVCDTVSDTVRISYDDTIRIELGPDTLLCNFPGGYVINPGLNVKADFEWSSEDTTVIISVVNTGIYSFTATNGCNTESDTVTVTFKPIPTDSLLPADTLNCFDKAIVLARPKILGLTYVWSDSSSKASYTVDTTEQVWLAAFNECGFSVDTMNIVFNGEIISELGIDTIICDRDFLTLNAFSPGATYLWSTGDTTDTIVTGRRSAFYTVTVTYKDCQTIESKNVEKSDLFCPGIDCNLQTTNVFSPNGDGINDLWRITSDCEISSYDLSIYNRWGQLVHFSNNSNFGWDGSINGEPASDGVYYYILHFKDGVVVDIDQFDFKGSITLVR